MVVASPSTFEADLAGRLVCVSTPPPRVPKQDHCNKRAGLDVASARPSADS